MEAAVRFGVIIAGVVVVVVIVALNLSTCLGDSPRTRPAKCTEFEGYAWAGDSCAARERAACRDFWLVGLSPSQCERYR